MVFLNKADPDDSLSATASWCLLHDGPFVQQLGATEASQRGTVGLAGSTQCWGTVVGEPQQAVPQQQDGGGRAFLATSTELPGLKAMRTMVKLMIESPKVKRMLRRCRRKPYWCLMDLSGGT